MSNTDEGAYRAGISVPALHDAFTEPGAGVRGMVVGRRVAVGQLRWVQAAVSAGEGDADASTSGRSLEQATAGETVVYCGIEGQGTLGALVFSDSLRWDFDTCQC